MLGKSWIQHCRSHGCTIDQNAIQCLTPIIAQYSTPQSALPKDTTLIQGVRTLQSHICSCGQITTSKSIQRKHNHSDGTAVIWASCTMQISNHRLRRVQPVDPPTMSNQNVELRIESFLQFNDDDVPDNDDKSSKDLFLYTDKDAFLRFTGWCDTLSLVSLPEIKDFVECDKANDAVLISLCKDFLSEAVTVIANNSFVQ